MQRLPNTETITGVIVTFNPDMEMLRRLIAAVGPQLSSLLIVDNGSHTDVAAGIKNTDTFEVVLLGQNFGIAHAQNIGIESARTRGSKYVLLLDQDSIPSPDMVATLLAALISKQVDGQNVACVGPRYTDSRTEDVAPFVKLEGLRLTRVECIDKDNVVAVDFVIASGCLIPMSTIDAVGLMRDEMFIDYVDIEWGLRAQNSGYLSYGVCAATMEHALGDQSVKFGRRHIPVHSPLRHYYHIRNAIWLSKQSWISAQWKIVLIWRIVRQWLFFSIMTSPRLKHAQMMSLGIVHGLVNRMGKR